MVAARTRVSTPVVRGLLGAAFVVTAGAYLAWTGSRGGPTVERDGVSGGACPASYGLPSMSL